jgi:hypothetical protein
MIILYLPGPTTSVHARISLVRRVRDIMSGLSKSYRLTPRLRVSVSTSTVQAASEVLDGSIGA